MEILHLNFNDSTKAYYFIATTATTILINRIVLEAV